VTDRGRSGALIVAGEWVRRRQAAAAAGCVSPAIVLLGLIDKRLGKF
jgi:hypothetical protein